MHLFNLFAANGDIIVTLLPVNSRFPWVTPAVFRPELVPEELMAQGLTVSTYSKNYIRHKVGSNKTNCFFQKL